MRCRRLFSQTQRFVLVRHRKHDITSKRRNQSEANSDWKHACADRLKAGIFSRECGLGIAHFCEISYLSARLGSVSQESQDAFENPPWPFKVARSFFYLESALVRIK